jgi:hypothetical protein
MQIFEINEACISITFQVPKRFFFFQESKKKFRKTLCLTHHVKIQNRATRAKLSPIIDKDDKKWYLKCIKPKELISAS